MGNWEVVPFEGIGNLRFGLTREQSRKLLDSDFNSFIRNAGENPTDVYPSLGLFLSYDSEDRLEFIELVPPAKPSFQNLELLSHMAEPLVKMMQGLGYFASKDDIGYDFKTLGIGLYVPEDEVESIAIYRLGYYES